MSNHYRLNVRFDLDDEAERRAAEYLAELNNEKGKSRNRFIVEAVISFMETLHGNAIPAPDFKISLSTNSTRSRIGNPF